MVQHRQFKAEYLCQGHLDVWAAGCVVGVEAPSCLFLDNLFTTWSRRLGKEKKLTIVNQKLVHPQNNNYKKNIKRKKYFPIVKWVIVHKGQSIEYVISC